MEILGQLLNNKPYSYKTSVIVVSWVTMKMKLSKD